jgi:predicted lipoprotein with Yx(FWY)xxD motif
MRWIALVALVALAVLGMGCGDDDADGDQGVSPSGAAAKQMPVEERAGSGAATRPATGRTIEVVGSEYGRVLADAKGEAFYLFDKEDSAKSECYGACASAWPPVLTRGQPRAGEGVGANLLGTTKRTNGRLQVTYAGQPLYYYVDDSPGTILCQNVAEFGGLWLVVKPNGSPVA